MQAIHIGPLGVAVSTRAPSQVDEAMNRVKSKVDEVQKLIGNIHEKASPVLAHQGPSGEQQAKEAITRSRTAPLIESLESLEDGLNNAIQSLQNFHERLVV